LELPEASVEEKMAKYNRIKEIASDFVVSGRGGGGSRGGTRQRR
jgi:hypothetical protein